MQVSENHALPLMPPPPPPPLPQIAKTNVASVKRLQTPAIHDVEYMFRDFPESTIVHTYRTLSPVIQDGPSCGIVALTMASQFFQGIDLTPAEVLTAAKNSDFTKSGEMFSAYNMASLATSLMGCETEVINDIIQRRRDILNHICQGFPVLMPYDADRNHSPCLNKGTNAHWAVLCGVCFSVPKHVLPSSGRSSNRVYRTTTGKEAQTLLNPATSICVYAYQGKSRHIALWEFDVLLLSNLNLFEVTKKYQQDNMVLPEGDALSELRNKAILLKGNLQ